MHIRTYVHIHIYDAEDETGKIIKMFSGFPAEKIYAHTYIRTYTYI